MNPRPRWPRPGPLWADRRETLHDRRPVGADFALLEGDDGQSTADDVQQFAAAEQEVGIRRPAEAFVPRRKRLVEQHAVVSQRRQQMWKQRTMQVVGDDDRVESRIAERPGTGFEIGDRRLDALHAGERRECGRVAVDCEHARPARCEQPRVPSMPGREIEHVRVRGDQMREADDPSRWRERCVILRFDHRDLPLRRDDGSARAASCAASSASQRTNAATSARSCTCGAVNAK